MELKEFYTSALPPTGNYWIAVQSPTGNFYQEKFEYLSDALRYMVDKSKTCNVYFATGSFGDARDIEHVQLKKSFYIDIDCGAGATKQYASKKDAADALTKFLKNTKFPVPTAIVDSGNGLHVYWMLKEAVSLQDWQPVALRLIEFCSENNLKIDAGITRNAACILRSPGTYNRKDPANPKPCKILSSRGGFYDINSISSSLGEPALSAANVLSAYANPDDLAINYAGNATYSIEHSAKKCKAMHDTLEIGGKDQPYMLWFHWMNVMIFAEDGRQYAHLIGNKHDGYTFDSTEKKYDHALTSMEKKNTGPTPCVTFAQYFPETCKSCKYFSETRSPLHLGQLETEPMPRGYKQSNKGLFMELRDEDGGSEYMIVCPYKFSKPRLFYDEEGVAIEFTVTKNDVDSVITMPVYATSDTKIMVKSVGHGGIALNQVQLRRFKDFMASWIQLLQETNKIQSLSTKYGWADDGTFIVGDVTYKKDGTRERAVTGRSSLNSMYDIKGEYDKWRQAAEFILNQKERYALHIALASAFGAPLMKFTGLSGGMLAIVSSKSGTGKSSTLKVAQAVWGDPKTGVNAFEDTNLSVTRKLGVINNLPAYWDELRGKEIVKKFIHTMFTLGQGKERSRLNSDTTFKTVGTWNTITVAASNESLLDHIQHQIVNSDAGTMRIIELYVDDGIQQGKLSDAVQLFGALDNNYGHAGAEYATWLAKSKSTAKAVTHKFMTMLDETLQPSADERFWVMTAAALLAGAYLAQKLNILNFDIASLKQFLINELKRIRNEKITHHKDPRERARELLLEFMNAHRDSTVILSSLPKPGHGSKSVTILEPKPIRSPIVCQIAKGDSPCARIAKKQFDRWLYDQDELPSAINKHLKDSGAVFKNTSIASGVANVIATKVYAIEIEFKGTMFESMLEDE